MDVLVSGEDDGEVRRISLTNSGRRAREIELTSYAELVLAPPAADNAHPAFSKMFVETEYLAEFGALIATRRPRSPSEPEVWAAHFAVVEGELTAEPQYETDRARFLGRGRTVGCGGRDRRTRCRCRTRSARFSIPSSRSGTASLIPPGGSGAHRLLDARRVLARELLDLIDKHHDRNAFDRAKTLAWTQAQVQLRHLGIEADEAADFQRLAAPILYADPRFRPPSDAIVRGAGPQSGLWPHGISGDLPIVLLRIDDIEDIAQVRQLLRAHEYWRMKRLAVDLVIINERASSYVQDLQIAIETAVRSSQSRPRFGEELAQRFRPCAARRPDDAAKPARCSSRSRASRWSPVAARSPISSPAHAATDRVRGRAAVADRLPSAPVQKRPAGTAGRSSSSTGWAASTRTAGNT